MSVVTETGDGGTTGLWSGERVGKDDLRVECYGTIDELNSFLGDARHAVKTVRASAFLDEIQEDLFRVAGMLATRGKAVYAQAISEEDIERLTKLVHQLESDLPMNGFVIPGSTQASAKIDICRTVCRRAERRVVALSRIESIDTRALRYLNRLADALFMIARYEEKAEGALRFKQGPESSPRD